MKSFYLFVFLSLNIFYFSFSRSVEKARGSKLGFLTLKEVDPSSFIEFKAENQITMFPEQPASFSNDFLGLNPFSIGDSLAYRTGTTQSGSTSANTSGQTVLKSDLTTLTGENIEEVKNQLFNIDPEKKFVSVKTFSVFDPKIEKEKKSSLTDGKTQTVAEYSTSFFPDRKLIFLKAEVNIPAVALLEINNILGSGFSITLSYDDKILARSNALFFASGSGEITRNIVRGLNFGFSLFNVSAKQHTITVGVNVENGYIALNPTANKTGVVLDKLTKYRASLVIEGEYSVDNY